MFGILSKNDWDYWYDSIYGFYFRRLDNKTDVEDLTSQTLNDFFLSKTKVEDATSFIFQIARNKLNTYLKSKYNKEPIYSLDDKEESVGYSPEFEKFKSNLSLCISEHLSSQDEEILNLCVVEDFQSKDVATRLGLTAGNVRIRLYRALKLLKEKCKHLKQI
jgi:RNA polymerase sigma factor (sigma-70 family)